MKTNFKTLEFIYQDTQIHFILGNEGNVMINATEMAKAFNKKLDNYMRLDSTKNLISELILDEKSISAPSHLREQNVVYATNRATYFNRILALDFATWIDIKFKIWIYKSIDKILFGDLPVKRKEDLELKADLMIKNQNLLEKLHESELYQEYMNNKKELSLVNSKLSNQDKQIIETKMKSLFEQDFIKN